MLAIAEDQESLVAFDLRFVHDFTNSIPGAFAELLDQVHQLCVHLVCKAGYLLFDILFTLHAVLIWFLFRRFGGTFGGLGVFACEDPTAQILESVVVFGSLLRVGGPIWLVDHD